MRLISLEIEAFRCIEKARVELTPGLNILHGPNDLGKSTIADAIRAVLLLTHSQREHHSFISWSADLSPKVKLELEMKEKGYYRVSKSFGDGNRGQSLLEYSKDGRDYVVTTKGREVDEELRKLLRWGVPPPGGRAGARGMPETYLSEVFMPHQSAVARVLQLSLEQDPDASGKEHLTQVLQAMATDPKFKKVFASALEKVEEAYTATGKEKSGKGSPWTDVQDQINGAQQEVDRLRADVAKSQDAESKVAQLSERLAEHLSKVEEARGRLDAMQLRWASRLRRLAAESELEEARSVLAETDRLIEAAAKTALEVGRLAGQRNGAKEKLVRTKESVEGAERALAQQEAQKVRLESDEGEQARIVERSKLSQALAEIAAALAEKANETARAEEAKRDMEAMRAIGTRAARLAGTVAGLSADRDAAKAIVEEAARSLEESAHLTALAKYLDAKRAYDEALASEEREAALQSEANAIEARLAMRVLPSKAQLQTLRALKSGLDVAEAEVAGLALSLRLERAFEVTIAADDEPEAKERVESAKLIEARRSIRIAIAGVGEITATAGRPEARSQAEELRRRWDEEGRGALDTAGAVDLDALAEMIDEAERQRRELESRLRDASSLAAGARDPGELGRAMKEREVPLRGLDRAALARTLEAIGGDRLDLEEAELRKKVAAASARVSRLELDLAKAQTELHRDEAAIREQKDRLEPRLASLGAAPDVVLARVGTEQRNLERRRDECKAKLEALEREARTATTDAAKAVDRALASLAAAKEACAKTEAELSESSSLHAAAEALLEERSNRAGAADRTAHQASVVELQRRLGEMVTDPTLTERAIEAARAELEREARLAESIEDDQHAARGALEQVGGSVVKDQESDWEDALGLARRKQQDVHLEYRAWQLLVEELRTAEEKQANHLGSALVEPISAQFKALTRGRYPSVHLGRNLDLENIVAEGAKRELESLSVGTKEQLATLIRICLAERLGTCLILDDQLTQSDPDRIGWLRDLLYETAQRLQIIVVTCRPDDYVRADRPCTVVDLARCVTRHGNQPSEILPALSLSPTV